MKEALKLALEALKTLHDENMDYLTRNRLGGENNQCMLFARETITILREALAQPERQPLTGDHTTFIQRFADAVAILCGAEPPVKFVDEWLRKIEVDGVARLQEWVLSQQATPSWAQGIVVLDAAYLLAESPEEGGQHEDAKP